MRNSWVNTTYSKVNIFAFNVPSRHGEAAAAIISSARNGLMRLYGLSVPRIEVVLYQKRGAGVRLWTNGQDTIFLTLRGRCDLKAPVRGGAHFVYGFCHELAHIAMYRRIRNVFALPPGWGEGWAHYVASMGLVPYVFERLGAQAWPDQYDYLKIEGPERFLRQLSSQDKSQANQTMKAAKVFYALEKRFGKKALGVGLRKCAALGASGDKFVRLYRKSVNGHEVVR